MTQIVVTPINRSAKGSYRQIKSLMKLAKAIEPGSGFDAGAFLEFLGMVEKHCTLPDGGDVQDALDDLSFEEFMLLAQAITGESVGEANSAS